MQAPKTRKPNILTIIGPTASGKSELAVKLAQKLGGEILSVDSRQIYRGLNIGTGKVKGRFFPSKHTHKKVYIYKKIPHYCIDEVSPRVQYSVTRFQKIASKAIEKILKKGKTPILCGGTAHWIDAVVLGQILPEVPPNPDLRVKLEKKSTEQLFQKLLRLDPARASVIDRHNKRRLVRALEIIAATGKPVPTVSTESKYNNIWIGINPPQDILFQAIEARLKQRLKAGMITEVKNLHKAGLSWKRLDELGLEYKYCTLYLRSKITKEELVLRLIQEIKKYSKRQMTWWKRNKDITWFNSPDAQPVLEHIKTALEHESSECLI